MQNRFTFLAIFCRDGEKYYGVLDDFFVLKERGKGTITISSSVIPALSRNPASPSPWAEGVVSPRRRASAGFRLRAGM